MGVPGLINLVRPVVQTVNLERFTGQRVGIDISSFAYKGCYSRSLELLRNAEDVRPYRFVFKRLALLTTAGITPVVVFDGAPLAAKAEENARRQRQRKAAREEALKLRKQGKVHEARKASRRALHVSRDMQRTLMAMLDRLNIEYVVAPYEADAQLAFMARTGRVAAVLSDDSDMLCFGVPHVLRNLRSSGTCDSIQFHHLQELTLTRYGVRLSLRDLRLDTLQLAAVLSGCDYLPKHSGAHIHGIGMRTAMYVTHKYKTYTDIMQHLRQKYIITDDLDARVRHAMLAFACQVVWDDTAQARRRLPPLAPEPADDDGDSAHPATTPLFELTSDPANEGHTVAGVVHVENAVERARGRADPDTGHTCHRVRLRPALKAIVSDMRNGRLETTSHRTRRPGRKPHDRNGRDDCGKSTKQGKRGQKRRGQDQNKNPRVAVLMPFKRLGVELERSKVLEMCRYAGQMKCTATTALYLHILRTAEQHHREILSTLADLAQTTRKEIVERKVAFREAQERAEGVEDLKKKKKKKDHKKSRAASPSDNPCKRAKGAAATTAATATAAAATTPPATATTVTAAATGKSPRPAYCFQHLAPQLTADKLSNLFTTLRNHKKHSQHPMLSILRQHGVGIPDPPKWMTATMAYKLLNLASKEFTPLLQRDLKNKARAAQRQLKKVAEHHDEGARFACEHTAELALYIGAAQHLARTLAPPDTDLTSLKIFPTFTNKHPFIQLDAGLLRDLTCFKCGRLGHSQRQCRQPAAVRPPPRQALSLLDFLGADVARQFRKRRVTSIRTDGYTAYLLVEPSARRDTVCDTSPITPVVGVDPGTRIPLACVRIQDGKKMMVSQKRIVNQLYTGRGRRHHKPTATVPARSGGSDEGGEQGGAMGKGETGSRRKKRERGKRTKRERSRRRKEKARIEKEEQLRRQQQEEQGGRDKGEGQEGRDKGEEEREQREREEQGGGAEPGSVDDVVASARECLREGVSRRELKWRLHEKLKHCRFRSRVAGELATRFGRDCRVFFGDCVHKGRGGGTKAPILELRRAIGCRVDTKIVEEFRTTKYSLCCAWPNRIDEQTRIATCTHCGASADRDVAAAKTIAARSLVEEANGELGPWRGSSEPDRPDMDNGLVTVSRRMCREWSIANHRHHLGL